MFCTRATLLLFRSGPLSVYYLNVTMSVLVMAGAITSRVAQPQPLTCWELQLANELLRRGWGGGTFPPSPSRMSSHSARRHTGIGWLDKNRQWLPLPHPEPVWSWLQTLQLAISRIICSSSLACPAPNIYASSSHPHPAGCPGILYGPPAASIIWTGGEALICWIRGSHRLVLVNMQMRANTWDLNRTI